MFSGVPQWSLAAQPSSAAPAVHNSGDIVITISTASLKCLRIGGCTWRLKMILSRPIELNSLRTQPFTIAKRMGLKRRPNPQRLDFICLVLYQVFELSYYAVYEYLKCLEKGNNDWKRCTKKGDSESGYADGLEASTPEAGSQDLVDRPRRRYLMADAA